jgi:hypothetical protein
LENRKGCRFAATRSVAGTFGVSTREVEARWFSDCETKDFFRRGYDATRLSPESGFVRIGTGRDAADTTVAPLSGPVEFQSFAIEVWRLYPTADFPHQPERAGLSERFV